MTIESEGRRLQTRIARLRSGRARRYSPELRRRIEAWIARARSAGMSWAAVGEALGIPWQTLTRWRDDAARAPQRMVEVAIVDEETVAAGLVVIAPSGLRVEGATVEQVAALLRALG